MNTEAKYSSLVHSLSNKEYPKPHWKQEQMYIRRYTFKHLVHQPGISQLFAQVANLVNNFAAQRLDYSPNIQQIQNISI
jgi:hypothetical protein